MVALMMNTGNDDDDDDDDGANVDEFKNMWRGHYVELGVVDGYVEKLCCRR